MQDRSLSPVVLLASFLSDNQPAGELFILTGERGAGKTTLCRALADRARESGVDVDGILSPAVIEHGKKIGIDLVIIGSGERRRLAERRELENTVLLSGPHTGAWQFDGEVLSWGNLWLQNVPAPALLILDELGPLEILDNQGLIAGLALIDRREYGLGCVVVRPELIGAARERWPWGRVLDISGDDQP